MSEEDNDKTKEASFGHDELCSQLVERLDNQFDETIPNVEPSLVIGLFGEWGSGKSHLLNLIEKHYSKKDNQIKTITIPIAFNPWRFEKEDHLIIPLMKTTELVLKTYVQENQPWLKENAKKFGKGIEKIVEKAARFSALSALALLGSLKGKVSIPGIGSAEVNGEDIVAAVKEIDKSFKEVDENAKKAAEIEATDTQIFDDLNSIYFNFYEKLKEAIGHDQKGGKSPKINLLFLIDDIDRCLPEKAVEMLESIKLFLDVEGCAFVLAVDDEIVERGIVHRYRDYIFQQQDNGNPVQMTAPPITGTEYLEKIIHLPYRLPLPTKDEIRKFLLQKFNTVFNVNDPLTEENAVFKEGAPLDLEQYELKGKRQSSIGDESSELLDLFVKAIPPVPRKLIRAVELFQLQKNILKARNFNNYDDLVLAKLVILQELIPEIYRFGRQNQGFLRTMEMWEEAYKGSWILPGTIVGNPNKHDNETLFAHQEKPLYDLIQKYNQPRSGFNVRNLINLKHKRIDSLAPYFCSIEDEKRIEQVSKEKGDDSSGKSKIDPRAHLNLSNETEFIEYITSKRSDAWSTVSGMSGIQNGIMSDTLYETFREALKDNHPLTADGGFLVPQWINIIRQILPTHKAQDLWGSGETSAVKVLVTNFEKGNIKDAKKRLQYGDSLAMLGDPREGVGVKENGLPDLIMEEVKEGNFEYGSEDNNSKETKYLKTFRISRYPITNQQFQCFVDAEDNNKDSSWWEGIPKDEFDNLESSFMAQANRPKETVSWYQAVAFAKWLSAKENKTYRLPTEFEWEKAARGTDGRKYPWEGAFDAAKLNNHEGGLGETSSVGMYTDGQSPYGVYDMSGNVWEWCLNKYEKPDDTSIDDRGESRTLRGGSFLNNSDNVRCAFRDRNYPDSRYGNLGFRLVCE